MADPLGLRPGRRDGTANDGPRSGSSARPVDEDGIAVFDTPADRPTVVRREPGNGSNLLGLPARTARSCSAVVATPLLPERRRWDLPGWELRSRRPLEEAPGAGGELADLRLTADR